MQYLPQRVCLWLRDNICRAAAMCGWLLLSCREHCGKWNSLPRWYVLVRDASWWYHRVYSMSTGLLLLRWWDRCQWTMCKGARMPCGQYIRHSISLHCWHVFEPYGPVWSSSMHRVPTRQLLLRRIYIHYTLSLWFLCLSKQDPITGSRDVSLLPLLYCWFLLSTWGALSPTLWNWILLSSTIGILQCLSQRILLWVRHNLSLS